MPLIPVASPFTPKPSSSNLRSLLRHPNSRSDGLVSINELETAWEAIPNRTVGSNVDWSDLDDIDLDFRDLPVTHPTPRATTAPPLKNITVSCLYPSE